ncbi:hypothetical protein [Flammeovirga aprica]|uniref:DUF3298 domain-containing protein n=1 Tax=Flammeovirga aprica JL-4 TaxID=694437 RepID=A0A7X9P0H4_9BACT|nr:hypothetical protein [Flammeovirga aprica]NME67296.1 hypothetical protein [Flammeovirga aprica JL-4]
MLNLFMNKSCSIILFLLLFCSVWSHGQTVSLENTHEKFFKVDTVVWEDTRVLNCWVDAVYPQLKSSSSFCLAINKQIREAVFKNIEKIQSVCEGLDESDLELVTNNDIEEYTEVFFEGGINSSIVSIVVKKNSKGAGAAYTHVEFVYYNFDIENTKPLYLNDIVEIDKLIALLQKSASLVENDVFDEKAILDFLQTPKFSSFIITKEGLKIDPRELYERSDVMTVEFDFSVSIDEIQAFLKIDRKLLPSPKEN